MPPGFTAEIWAEAPGARSLARGDEGTIFVGTRRDRVYAITDTGARRQVRTIVRGLTEPNGVAFRNGALYVAAIDTVLRYDGIESRLDAPPKPADLSAAFKLPEDRHHGWRFIAFGPDGRLYIPVGAPCNVCARTPQHAQIRRYNADGSGMEVVAIGVRNTVGFDFHPQTRALWFTDNGRDHLGNDRPEDELNRVARLGADYGFPYCHAQGIADPSVRKPDPCAGTVKPVALLGPHAAALGMRFYTGAMFPAAYRGRIFVARHGSWNRDRKFGYDVVTVAVTADGSGAKVEPFLTGLLDAAANESHGRPVDVLVMPDGALLVSDDSNGIIYRIAYAHR
ncbi:MAG: PQQ-dependent sugar dehydrogenase [Rhodospirillaceae bacterium]|nr:PQQ-dependent sugar dehydrogenase [Rhodospirillaceae bacterium]